MSIVWIGLLVLYSYIHQLSLSLSDKFDRMGTPAKLLVILGENNCERLNLPTGIPNSLNLKERSRHNWEYLKIFDFNSKIRTWMILSTSFILQTYRIELQSRSFSSLHLQVSHYFICARNKWDLFNLVTQT